MQTHLVLLTKENYKETLSQAAAILKSCGLVVFPTETVYGLGANATDERAVKKIFEAKGRPSDNPVIVHIASKEQLQELVAEISPLHEKLMAKFWPGPLTLIFKKNKRVPSATSGGLDTVAVRMPAHSFAKDLIKKAGVPIAAPSANISGTPSMTAPEHALELVGKVDMIIDAGFSEIGLESTVVKVEKDLVLILRPGAITKEMLEEVVYPNIVLFATEEKDLHASPGTKYKHYAPKAKLEILDSQEELEKRKAALEKENKKVGILEKTNLEEASKNLYRRLRELDKGGVDVILAESYLEAGLGAALMDRLRKASAQ